MKKILITFAAAAFMLASCSRPVLPSEHWNKTVHDALNGLIKSVGSSSKDYDKNCRPYAVFDFDNTTVINDIELTSFTYVIENLLFIEEPVRFNEVITACVPDMQHPLDVKMDRKITPDDFVSDITADYAFLFDNYIDLYPDKSTSEAVKDLKKIKKTRQYKDFRAKLWAYYEGICNTFSYSVGCLWIQTIYDGMSYDRIQEIVKDALTYYSDYKPIENVLWTSPDMGDAGKVSYTHAIGFAISDEMHQLYRTLTDNGIDVYVVSASMEAIAEEAACDQRFGFGLDRDYVYGLRMDLDSTGLHHAVFDTTYHQTFKEGKTKAIIDYIAPSHGGKGPVLVAGDSNGDFSMLTSFSDLKVGLIIDCGNTGNIGDLMTYARLQNSEGQDKAHNFATSVHLDVSPDAQYVVQCRNYAKGKFIKKDQSKPAK